MATYDMTSIDTAGVGANSIAVPTNVGNTVRTIEAILDIDAMVTAGYSGADGDIFQLLEIPSESVMLAGGAQILKAFTDSCTCDIDFAAGDDIIDGADLTQAAGTYLALVGAADTIDVKIDGAAPATGRLRVYAVIADISPAMTEAAVAQRDLL